jgi:hypothetical protein
MNSLASIFLKTPIPKHQQRPEPGFMCVDAGFEFFNRPLDDPSGKRSHEPRVQQSLIHYFTQRPAQPGGQWNGKPHLVPLHKIGREVTLRQLLQQVFADLVANLIPDGQSAQNSMSSWSSSGERVSSPVVKMDIASMHCATSNLVGIYGCPARASSRSDYRHGRRRPPASDAASSATARWDRPAITLSAPRRARSRRT